MVVDELSSWCLYDTPSVGGGVVWLAFAECNTLGHCVLDGETGETIWRVRYSVSGDTDVRWGVLHEPGSVLLIGSGRGNNSGCAVQWTEKAGARGWHVVACPKPAIFGSLRAHVTLQACGWQETRTKNGFSTWFERVQILEYQSLPARLHPLSSHPHPQLIWRLPR